MSEMMEFILVMLYGDKPMPLYYYAPRMVPSESENEKPSYPADEFWRKLSLGTDEVEAALYQRGEKEGEWVEVWAKIDCRYLVYAEQRYAR